MAAQAAQEPDTEFLLQYVKEREQRTPSYSEVGYHLPHCIVVPTSAGSLFQPTKKRYFISACHPHP